MQSSDSLPDLDAAAWVYGALIATMREAVGRPIGDVLAAEPHRTAILELAGLVRREQGEPVLSPDLPRDASAVSAKLSSFRQAVAAATGDGARGSGWGSVDDEVLRRQGRASAMTGRVLATTVVPAFDGLAERLLAPGGRILDVGTGIGAIAAELAKAFPRSRVLGIDILDRVLEIAKAELPADLADRVSLRRLDVADLSDSSRYDLVWLPAPFLSEATLAVALPLVIRALRPAGCVVVGSNLGSTEPIRRAVDQWKAVLNGGSVSRSDDIADILARLGLTNVRRFPTVPNGPVLIAGQRAGNFVLEDELRTATQAVY